MSEIFETTIQITSKTRDRIKKFWTHADDTYDTVLNHIIDEYEKQREE